MICNAGFGVAGAIDEMPSEKMRQLLHVNYLGTYYAARAALAVFRRQGRGHLIIVSSIVGLRGVVALERTADGILSPSLSRPELGRNLRHQACCRLRTPGPE